VADECQWYDDDDSDTDYQPCSSDVEEDLLMTSFASVNLSSSAGGGCSQETNITTSDCYSSKSTVSSYACIILKFGD